MNSRSCLILSPFKLQSIYGMQSSNRIHKDFGMLLQLLAQLGKGKFYCNTPLNRKALQCGLTANHLLDYQGQKS
ncbi:hypothetical protein P3L10_029454 [Capsicum annuum]